MKSGLTVFSQLSHDILANDLSIIPQKRCSIFQHFNSLWLQTCEMNDEWNQLTIDDISGNWWQNYQYNLHRFNYKVTKFEFFRTFQQHISIDNKMWGIAHISSCDGEYVMDILSRNTGKLPSLYWTHKDETDINFLTLGDTVYLLTAPSVISMETLTLLSTWKQPFPRLTPVSYQLLFHVSYC